MTFPLPRGVGCSNGPRPDLPTDAIGPTSGMLSNKRGTQFLVQVNYESQL
jgi:hypothetical protein